MQLLDFYMSRFGRAVKRQGNGWNGPCPICGGEPGKSDRFVVWPERSEGLGKACAEHGIAGIWSCRQCGASGDTIAYLEKAEGMDFRQALAALGIESEGMKPRPAFRRRAPREPVRQEWSWQPRESEQPSEAWSAYAAKLLIEARAEITRQPLALRWLAARGIDEQAIAAYQIGYLPPEGKKYAGRWRARSALGLQPKTGDDGKVRERLFIPRGIVIPTFGQGGKIINLRFRRHREDISGGGPKYMELEGSSRAPLLLRPSAPSHLAAYAVVEAELDAMLIHHATGGMAGALAVRTNRGKPDAAAHKLLEDAAVILIALDYDQAGAEGVEWWEETYPQSRRWPTPEGKDPGDAFRLGVDIRAWISAALPLGLAEPSGGQADKLAPGQLSSGGKGQKPATPEMEEGEPSLTSVRVAKGVPSSQEALPQGETRWARPADFTPVEQGLLRTALMGGLDLGLIPLEVARIWLLWRRIPLRFVKLVDELGRVNGFEWQYPRAWARTHADLLDAFFTFEGKSRALWQWLEDHAAREITARNLFCFFGGEK